MRPLLLLVGLMTACRTSPSTSEESVPPARTLALGGDVMFGRWTTDGFVPHDAALPDSLREADVAFVNLETGICDRPYRLDTASTAPFPLLAAPEDRLDRLVEAGVDVVSVANNHVLDCGPRGLAHTVEALDARGIEAVGVAGQDAVAVNGVLLYAATFHPPPYGDGSPAPRVFLRHEESAVLTEVTELREQHPDSPLVVSLHWGREGEPGASEWQLALARRLVDAGTTVVAGHGPHVAHPLRSYRGASVATSLGDLAFDGRTEIAEPLFVAY